MKYQNKQNGKIVTEARFNEKTKTYILIFEDGSGTTISSSTFKRWYKAIEGEDEVAPLIDLDNPITDEEAKERGMVTGDEALEQSVVTSDDICGDGRKYSEIGKEIAQQAKEKAKKASTSKKMDKPAKKKKEMESYVTEALEFIYTHVESNGDEIFKPTKDINMRAFKVGGHMYCKFNYSNSSITIGISSKAFTEKNMVEPTRTVNHTFDNLYVYNKSLTKADKDTIIKILKIAREYRLQKNNKASK